MLHRVGQQHPDAGWVAMMPPRAGSWLYIDQLPEFKAHFPSVLMGIPGSSGSQATIMDGYPMARRGGPNPMLF